MNAKQFKQQLLEELYAPYQKCVACPLGTLGRKNVVFGDGNPNADFIIIGEGPGRDEDAQGKPFVGRAGKLLNKVLELANIDRQEIYITNIVKCRPPNNRTPLPNEATTCKNLLLVHQIKIIRPRIICTLGAAAAKEMLGDPKLKISRIRGTLFDYKGIPVLPAYHPAYILRNPKELESLVTDVKKAISLIK